MFDAKFSAKTQKDVLHDVNINKDELNKSLFWAVFHIENEKIMVIIFIQCCEKCSVSKTIK